MVTVPSTFAELIDQDLAGFQFTRVYWMEPNHGLWAEFPALIVESGKPVICRSEELLRRVEELLPKRGTKKNIVQMWALVHVEHGYGFWIHDADGSQSQRKPFTVLSEEEFARLTQDPTARPFAWQPGLMGG
jgi:hypothetical protein